MHAPMEKSNAGSKTLPASAGFYSDPTGFNSICFPGHHAARDSVLKDNGKQTNRTKKVKFTVIPHSGGVFNLWMGKMVLVLSQVMSDAVWGWFQVLICWPFSPAAAAAAKLLQ